MFLSKLKKTIKDKHMYLSKGEEHKSKTPLKEVAILRYLSFSSMESAET